MSMTLIDEGDGPIHSIQVLRYPEEIPDAQQEIRFKIEPGLGMVVQ